MLSSNWTAVTVLQALTVSLPSLTSEKSKTTTIAVLSWDTSAPMRRISNSCSGVSREREGPPCLRKISTTTQLSILDPGTTSATWRSRCNQESSTMSRKCITNTSFKREMRSTWISIATAAPALMMVVPSRITSVEEKGGTCKSRTRLTWTAPFQSSAWLTTWLKRESTPTDRHAIHTITRGSKTMSVIPIVSNLVSPSSSILLTMSPAIKIQPAKALKIQII